MASRDRRWLISIRPRRQVMAAGANDPLEVEAKQTAESGLQDARPCPPPPHPEVQVIAV